MKHIRSIKSSKIHESRLALDLDAPIPYRLASRGIDLDADAPIPYSLSMPPSGADAE